MKVYRLYLAPQGLFPSGKMMKSLLSLPCSLRANVKALGLPKPAKKFGYTRQRYYQILDQFKNHGAEGLKSLKTRPQSQLPQNP